MKLSTTQVWVLEQDEAVSFWTDQVGFEVKEDVTIAELGNFRWVTVGPKDQDGTAIVLMTVPGQPVMDADQVRLTCEVLAGDLLEVLKP